MKRRSVLKTITLGMGYTISAAGMATFITGCKQDGTIKEVAGWKPAFLSNEQRSLVENILEAMLPHSDSSPGYKEVGAIQIVDNTLNKIYGEEDQGLFREGLDILKSKFDAEKDLPAFMAKYMSKRSEAEKSRISSLLNKDIASLTEAEFPEYGIYRMVSTLRQLGISSYFATETIGTEYLDYDPVPGLYNGCMPVSEIGNVSAL